MTFSSKELAANGVHPDVLEFRRWRRERRLTQTQAAKLLGCCDDALTSYENGRRGITTHPACARMLASMRGLMTSFTEEMRPAKKPHGRIGRRPWNYGLRYEQESRGV